MSSFDPSIRFQGTFRSYQQGILDRAEDYWDDGQIHIVAAPGSGKTILGLELIRRKNAPALILSPSVTIRQQWGERFRGNFLPSGRDDSGMISFRLSEPRLITSVTYQALHAAWTGRPLPAEDDGDEQEYMEDTTSEEDNAPAEFSARNELIEAIHKAGIRTICLDEAHHLRSEWQKALEAFLKALKADVSIIALTATPPYDSTPEEWKRYMTVCGEIDAEIFVPQLVSQKSLCPHQDYIYFNYPAAPELDALQKYRQIASETTHTILTGPIFGEILEASALLTRYREMEETLLEYADQFSYILILAHARGENIPRKLIRLLTGRKSLPSFTSIKYAEWVFNFILAHPELFSPASVEHLHTALSHAGLIKRHQVCLLFDDKLKRTFISSVGKLESITIIAEEEHKQLGRDLRLLVLTDHIKKNLLSTIGSDRPLQEMGTVPIFEAIRRKMGEQVGIALLSGTLVLWPSNTLGALMETAHDMGISLTSRPLPNVPYCELNFSGQNKNKVAVITKAFRQGHCQILVGTKSLLGEGWDSPCINSLILASFIGSFMLSNQMRGRAIRIDPDKPDKTANIWHLATLEPEAALKENTIVRFIQSLNEEPSRLESEDYDMLTRRFESFMGPSYRQGQYITNGIERLDIIQPPYTKKHIQEINEQMLSMAADREGMRKRWEELLQGSDVNKEDILETVELNPPREPTKFIFFNLLYLLLLGGTLVAGFASAGSAIIKAATIWQLIALIATFWILHKIYILIIYRILPLLSPEKTIRSFATALLSTMKECGKIASPDTIARVASFNSSLIITCELQNGSLREKTLFRNAIGELLSPIDNPRYLLIRQDFILGALFLDYDRSYACPAILGNNKESAEAFQEHLDKLHCPYKLVFTRNEVGRKILLKCRNRSRINRTGKFIKRFRIFDN